MSVYNIFNMAAGEELGRYFAADPGEALNAMAREAGFKDYEQARGQAPDFCNQVFITEL